MRDAEAASRPATAMAESRTTWERGIILLWPQMHTNETQMGKLEFIRRAGMQEEDCNGGIYYLPAFLMKIPIGVV